MHERDIFLEALEQHSLDERDSFLDRTCAGDAQLRSRVELLLKSHEEADNLLDHPALGDAPTEVGAESTDRSKPQPSEHDAVTFDFLEPSDQPDSLGRLGQYDVREVVGHGGMGIVFKAHDTKLSRVVAVKVLSPTPAANAAARKRFLREARAAAAVSHDHVVTVYAVEENEPSQDSPRAGRGGPPYLVMEFVDGQSLEQKIDRAGHLELKEILRIGRQVAAGLEAAHRQGLIHRDIKPSNILLQNSVERVKITDFGLARAADDVGITHTGEVAGTPQYMSPEQAQGNPVDARSDLFSLGCVLYAMCTGRSPFRAESAMAALRRVCDDTPRPIHEINPDVPVWLVAVIQRLLEKDPDHRFQFAAEVCQVLDNCLAHVQDPAAHPLPVLLGAEDTVQRNRSAVRFHGRRWAAALLIAVLVPVTLSEATGVTNLAATVVRIAMGAGTLVIEVDDPTVQVSLDGEQLSITGAGIQELTLRPGQYLFQAIKNGQPVKQELVTITRGDRQVVQVRLEPRTSTTQADEQLPEYTCTPESAITQLRRLKSEFDLDYWVTGLAFSPDGTQLLCGRCAHVIEIWDLASGQRTNVKPIGARFATSRAGDLMATNHPDRAGCATISHVHDLSTIRVLVPQEAAAKGKNRDISLSPDGKYAMAGNADCTACLWDVATGQELHCFVGERQCFVTQFSPDSQTVLVGNQTLRLFNVASGQEIWRIDQGGFTCAVAFSPCGRWLVTTPQGQLRLWDVATGEAKKKFSGHTGLIVSVQFLPDGRHIISGSEDRTMRLWNVETGQEIACVTTQNHCTNHVAVSPDGRCAASGGGQFTQEHGVYPGDGDYDIRLWQLPETVWSKDVRDVSQ